MTQYQRSKKWEKKYLLRVGRNYHAVHHEKTRKAAIKCLGNKCWRCGFKDWRALQIDHIHGGGLKEIRAIGSQSIVRKIAKGESPIGYQLLCANCNWIKRYEQNEHNNHQYRSKYIGV